MPWVFIFEKHMSWIEKSSIKAPNSANDPNYDTYFSCKVGNYVPQHEVLRTKNAIFN